MADNLIRDFTWRSAKTVRQQDDGQIKGFSYGSRYKLPTIGKRRLPEFNTSSPEQNQGREEQGSGIDCGVDQQVIAMYDERRGHNCKQGRLLQIQKSDI